MNKSKIITTITDLQPQLANKLFMNPGQALSTSRRIKVRSFDLFSLTSRKAGTIRNQRHSVFIESTDTKTRDLFSRVYEISQTC